MVSFLRTVTHLSRVRRNVSLFHGLIAFLALLWTVKLIKSDCSITPNKDNMFGNWIIMLGPLKQSKSDNRARSSIICCILLKSTQISLIVNACPFNYLCWASKDILPLELSTSEVLLSVVTVPRTLNLYLAGVCWEIPTPGITREPTAVVVKHNCTPFMSR